MRSPRKLRLWQALRTRPDTDIIDLPWWTSQHAAHGRLKQQTWISHSSGGLKPRIKVPVTLVAAEACFPGLSVSRPPPGPHMAFPLWCSGRELAPVSLLLVRTPVLWDQSTTLMTSSNLNDHPRDPISNYSHTEG